MSEDQAERRLQAIMAASPVAMQVFAADGRPVLVNSAWEKMWGVSLSWLQEVGYNVLQDQELDQLGVKEEVRRAFRGEVRVVGPLLYDRRRESGGQIQGQLQLRTTLYPVFDQQQQVREVVVMHEDMRAEAFAQSVIAAEVDGIAVCHGVCQPPYVHFTVWNPAMQRLTGYTLSEINRLGWYQTVYVDPEVQEKARQRMERMRCGDHLQAESWTITRKDGQKRIVEISTVEVVAEDIHSVMAVMRDVTEQRMAERALEEARQAAERASQAKSEFLALMSHEIRTPINIMIGMSDLLQETAVNARQKELLARLQGAGNHLIIMVNQILDLSRLETDRLRLETKAVALRVLLAEVMEPFQDIAAAKRLSLQYEIHADVPPWLMVDGLRLRQILSNLLDNAIKFTDRGGVWLRVGTDQDGSKLLLQVEDSGIGIAKGDLHRIFDYFTQVDSSYTRHYGGVGLGLALVRRLAERMEGSIEVESRIGQGSCFRLWLPLQAAEMPVQNRCNAGREGALSILLVEDMVENQELIRIFLQGSGHRLQVVADGLQAYERVLAGGIELVLMDVQMPVMDGYEATRRIRRWEQEQGQQRLPIITLTAHALEGEETRSQQAGCDLYLTKPIRKKRLLEVINQYAVHHPLAR